MLRPFLRPSRWPVLLREATRGALVVLAGCIAGLALELLIQLFGAMVVPDAFEGFPVWYHLGKVVLFQLAQIVPALLAGGLARRYPAWLGAVTAMACALVVDLAFHGAMPGSVSQLVSPLSLALGAGMLGAVAGLAGANLAQRWRARRAAPSP